LRRNNFAAGPACFLVIAMATVALAQAPQPNNYGDVKSWLCKPDRPGACDADLTTTIIGSGGKLTRETFKPDPQAPIDCFYVYPTVSTDPTPNSDMNPDPAEMNVIRQQFARFTSECRPYAPLYRQVTLAGLRTLNTGGGRSGSLAQGLQYDDIRDAWNYYLEHDNKGRGFVLIGHSQGSFILDELIRKEIDGKSVQSKMVSAILLGATLSVPRGKDVGGSFQHIPLCHSATQTGCVITYVSFRSTVPPPENTRFGSVADPNMVAACTNPAALAGGRGDLHAYLSADGSRIVGTTKPKPWVTPDRPIETPWVSVPGLLTAECKSNDRATYLEVTAHADPAGARTDDIVGDLTPDWGLHLVDFNVSMGNLIDIVGQQAKAWVHK
jgi:Protein of unknown function (DUF3089)